TEQVEHAIDLAQRRGIQAGMFLMWGYEGEEMADIEKTVDHVKRCKPDVYLTTVTYPIKGTPYYTQVADKLVRPPNWSTSTDRDFKIQGRHSRRYFQFADELLRGTVDADAARVASARAGLEASFSELEVDVRGAGFQPAEVYPSGGLQSGVSSLEVKA